MDSLFHFVFPLIAALAARLHVRHGLEMVFALALGSVLLDVDHIIGVPRCTLHNVFITLVIPLILLALAVKYEKRGTYWKTLCLGLVLFLSSHVILDMFTEGGVKLLYPLSDQSFTIPVSWSVALPSGQSYLVSAAGVGLTIYFAIILLIIFAEDFFAFLARGETAKKGFKDTMRKEKRKLRREL